VADVLISSGSEFRQAHAASRLRDSPPKAGLIYEFYACPHTANRRQDGRLGPEARKKGFKVVIAGAGLSPRAGVRSLDHRFGR